MSVNKIILIGNVGSAPDVNYLDNGTVVAEFPLATSETRKGKNGEKIEITTWHNIVAWKGTAEIVEKYVNKGATLYIEGKQVNKIYTDKNGEKRYTSEVNVNVLKMIGGKSGK